MSEGVRGSHQQTNLDKTNKQTKKAKSNEERGFTGSEFAGGLEHGECEQIGGHTQEGTVLVGLLRDGSEVVDLTVGVGVLHEDSKHSVCV